MCFIFPQSWICIVIIHTKSNITFCSFDICDEGIEPGDTYFIRIDTGVDSVYELPFVDGVSVGVGCCIEWDVWDDGCGSALSCDDEVPCLSSVSDGGKGGWKIDLLWHLMVLWHIND